VLKKNKQSDFELDLSVSSDAGCYPNISARRERTSVLCGLSTGFLLLVVGRPSARTHISF